MVLSKYLGPVNQESTPSIIAGKLREAISHGALPPGSQLIEAELARELGVSRGPLREAMQRLTQEGLLVSIRHRGLFVIELTEADVRDIYLARTAVERAAATEIFGHDPAAAGSRLVPIAQTMAQASERGDAAAIGEADIQFHKALVDMAQSPRLSRMHNTLLTETVMCITALQDTYPAPDYRVREHREIAEAFITGDAELAVRLLIAHMDDAVGRLGRRSPSEPSQT